MPSHGVLRESSMGSAAIRGTAFPDSCSVTEMRLCKMVTPRLASGVWRELPVGRYIAVFSPEPISHNVGVADTTLAVRRRFRSSASRDSAGAPDRQAPV